MDPIVILPGSFDPPTLGHLALARKALEIFPSLIVVCSLNPNKSGQWFTPNEAKGLWHSYDLPENLDVRTIDEFSASRPDPSRILMVRGLRSAADVEEEKRTMLYNHRFCGITRFLYIFNDEYVDVSSTKARTAARAGNAERLNRCVSPVVAAALLERAALHP